MTDGPDIPENQTEKTSPAPQKLRISLNKDDLKDKASKTWKGAWTAIGGLATIGGVIGLFQFMANGPSAQTNSTENLLVAMVTEGVISEDQAGNLSKLLLETSSQQGAKSAEAVKSALEDQDKDALIAMAKTFDEDTREEGLDMLEAAAETSEDWQTIAQLSYVSDPQRSLRAAEKAVKLDPEDFPALVFLVQQQSAAGEYTRSRRSVESARILARTPEERLLASQVALSVSRMGLDKPSIEKDLSELEMAVNNYKPILDAANFDEPLTKANISKHPVWMMGFINQVMASTYLTLEDYEKSRSHALESIEFFKRLEPHVDKDMLKVVQHRQSSELKVIFRTYFAEEKYEDARKYIGEVIGMYESRAGKENDEKSIFGLASGWNTFASSYYKEQKWDQALKAYEKGEAILQSLVERNPEFGTYKDSLDQTSRVIAHLNALIDGTGNQADVYVNVLKNARVGLSKAPKDKNAREKFEDSLDSVMDLLMYKGNFDQSSLDLVLKEMDIASKDLEASLGPNQFSYNIMHSKGYFLGQLAKDRDDQEEARKHFQDMLHYADLMIGAPDADEFDFEKEGIYVETTKITALYFLATLDGENALDAAKRGLRLAEARNAAGQLRTRGHTLIQMFKERIEELEAGD